MASTANQDDSIARSLRSVAALAVTATISSAFFGTLWALRLPPDSFIVRYTMGHWIECVEVIFFIWGMSELLLRWMGQSRERLAIRRRWLSPATTPIPVDQVGSVVAELEQAPRSMRGTYLGRRLLAVAKDVHHRQASDHLDEYMRELADRDADEVHASFSLPRVIAWAVPILGFLGTVVGITIAIANITPSQLEESLPEVTSGLAVAFDTTALALTLSMGLIFTMLVVERSENAILGEVDKVARSWLGHRFLQTSTEGTPYLAAVQAAGHQAVALMRELAERQSKLWADALTAVGHQVEALHAKREASFEEAMRRLADQWSRDVRFFEASHQKMGTLEQKLSRVAELMLDRAGDERLLLATQERLSDNLRLLKESQSFDEALHSLTAAIHLLTVRAHAVAGPTRPNDPDGRREPRAA